MTDSPTGTPGAVRCDDGVRRCIWAAGNDALMRAYHDEEWGEPVLDERGLFERLMLEAFQSGLSWRTILLRREGFRDAFANFDPDIVATFDENDIERLMQDFRIIRNRLKINATLTNAKAAVALRERGGLPAFVAQHAPARTPAAETIETAQTTSVESRALARALKQAGFVFVGPTTMYALMQAVGLVNGHFAGCHRCPPDPAR